MAQALRASVLHHAGARQTPAFIEPVTGALLHQQVDQANTRASVRNGFFAELAV